MSPLKCWTRSMVMLLALVQPVHAEITVSQSNDPAAQIGMNLVTLFSQEKRALDGMSAGRLNEIIVSPKKTSKSRGAKTPPTYDESWIAAIPPGKRTAEQQCLARAIYFEARGESIKGQAAVAEVIMNRMDSHIFPGTICGVVNQSGAGGCQFSFTCDGRSDRISDRRSWYMAEKIASALLAGAPRELTEGATYFHTPSVRPSWSHRFIKTVQIGSHYFYRPPVVTAMN